MIALNNSEVNSVRSFFNVPLVHLLIIKYRGRNKNKTVWQTLLILFLIHFSYLQFNAKKRGY